MRQAYYNLKPTEGRNLTHLQKVLLLKLALKNSLLWKFSKRDPNIGDIRKIMEFVSHVYTEVCLDLQKPPSLREKLSCGR